MKGDFSRHTFAREKHYSAVLMQQGRVEVDADFNEQQTITRYRQETETRDVIGRCGTPLDPPGYTHASGFEIVGSGGTPATTFTIGAGRYYVAGLLAENEAQAAYTAQAIAPLEYPASAADVPAALGTTQLGLVYLDVWRRHVTRLEDASMHEVALGEADTTTRAKTTWQVKVLPLPETLAPAQVAAIDTFVAAIAGAKTDDQRAQLSHDIEVELGITCDSAFAEWTALLSPSLGTMSAKSRTPALLPDPCLPPPSAGFTRLENQLYRVEVHNGGVLPGGAPSFKWSRENGSVVTTIEEYDSTDPTWLTLHDLGRDTDSLGFSIGDWVEVINDYTELATDGTQLGYLATIVDMEAGRTAVELSGAPPAVGPASLRDLSLNPRLRRWDQVTVAAILSDPGPPPTPGVPGVTPDANGIAIGTSPIPLEDGIQVTFSNGTYRPGDYWEIPARTAIGDIEWPRSGGNPVSLPPRGIDHHFCRLALVVRNSGGTGIAVVSDCRNTFPPLTALESFFYLGGDGQEVMPDPTDPTALVPLPEPIEVGVARGEAPLAGATVRFEVLSAEGGVAVGEVSGAASVEVLTGADGVASCVWSVASNFPVTGDARHQQHQQVRATLLDEPAGTPVHLPITFTANLSDAADVRYTPPCDHIPFPDVQAALDWEVELTHLHYVSGDGALVPTSDRGVTLAVRVASDCDPIEGAIVEFAGDGTFASPTATTDSAGNATIEWTLADWIPAAPNATQRATATLANLGPNANAAATIHAPTSTVDFVGHLNIAELVSYTPGCAQLTDATTVQDAIDELCGLVQGASPAIHVKEVLRGNPGAGNRLVNDADVAVDDLLMQPAGGNPVPGITMLLSDPLDPASVAGKFTSAVGAAGVPNSHPTCYVTLFLPWPLEPADISFWGTEATVAFQPVVLADDVRLLSDNTEVAWSPTILTASWLRGLLPRLNAVRQTQRVLARLTLKGDFVHTPAAADGKTSPRYLDGDPFGPIPTVGFQRLSGDGRPGGDFELWFWLTEKTTTNPVG